MESSEIIQQTDQPRTRKSLSHDLKELGVQRGMTLVVHTSLKSLGWVCGGAETVILALMDVITEEGTIIIQSHSSDLSDPAHWSNPPVPEEWWETIRETMPAFNPITTPTRGLGKIPELFRTFPGVYRSDHPNMSASSWGKHAKYITQYQSLDNGLGESSPNAKAYELDAHVLFLGTDFDTNTSFHLAEHRAGVRKTVSRSAPIQENGKRVWKSYLEIDYDDAPFGEIGKAFQAIDGKVKEGQIGSANCKFFEQKDSVDFAVEWLKTNNNL